MRKTIILTLVILITLKLSAQETNTSLNIEPFSSRYILMDKFKVDNNPSILDAAVLASWYALPDKRENRKDVYMEELKDSLKITIGFLNEIASYIVLDESKLPRISKIIMPCYNGMLPLITLEGIYPERIVDIPCRELFLKKYADFKKNEAMVKNQSQFVKVYNLTISYLIDILRKESNLNLEGISRNLLEMSQNGLDSKGKQEYFKICLSQLIMLHQKSIEYNIQNSKH